MIEDRPDGIYFALPETDYHALPRLSASGVCNMRVSPATFWAKSWMNPDRDDDSDQTGARIIGDAYHKARLEPELFGKLYARMLDRADFEISTLEGMRAELKARGEKQTVSGETAFDAAGRLVMTGYDKPLYHIDAEQWARRNEGKIGLKPETFDQIVADAERLRLDPEISKLLSDGFPEVSILWTSETTFGGTMKWKARLDYLTRTHIADLKTFANPNGKELDRCLADAVRFNRYYIPGVLYWQAMELIRTENPLNVVASLSGPPTEAQLELIDDIRSAQGPLEWWWVFQEKDGVPNILARQFRMTNDAHPHHLYQAPDAESREAFRLKMQKPSMLFEKGRLEIDDAVRVFHQCMEVWGDAEPWGALQPVGEIGDADFNQYWLDGSAP